MCYDAEFYNEPSEYEQMVDEFRLSLMQSVKKEFLDKMQRLEKENAELREVKRNWERLKSEYEEKQRELRYQIEQERRNVQRERLAELFKQCGMNVALFKPKGSLFMGEKCEKCDDDRMIHFKSPSGRDCKERCECCHGYYPVSPVLYNMVTFHRYIKNQDCNVYAFFKDESDDDYDYYRADPIACTNLYHGQDFSELYAELKENVFFEDEEQCRLYCDYINEIREIPKEILKKMGG